MKKYIKWIICYSIIIVPTALVALIFPETLRLNYYSFVPAACMVIWVACPFLYQIKLNTIAVFEGDETEGLSAEELGFIFTVLHLFLPFVFFFSSVVKCLSVLLIVGAYLGIIVYLTRKANKMINTENAKIQKELEEQKKREELGRWK